ncbi:class I SAM-dependent methyltransferase [Hugenholtzia roseola]|uniref:class I SAM-dependent methyltransferase n=1 Tax=Hugenholtzia roseola TaxID=1002 RepID=UPI0003FDDABB|nr:methyltransferase domain-containing protein [Hugenholtzia roseola]
MKKNLIYTDRADLYALWRKALFQDSPHIPDKQVQFLKELLGEPQEVGSLIDLGGGVGMQALPLWAAGYQVTVLDISTKALQILKQKAPDLPTIEADFGQMQLETDYQVAICLWSTVNYLLTKERQQHFFEWLKARSQKMIVIDQANFLRYSKTQTATYQAEDSSGKIKIERQWRLENQMRHTQYSYFFTNPEGETQRLQDSERQYFFTVEEMKKWIGEPWKCTHLLGEYDLNAPFEPQTSTRLITIFEK